MKAQPNKPQYYGKLAKRGLVWGGLRVGTNTLIQIPTAVVMARLLTPTEFGVSIAAYFFLQLASRLTQFGFGTSLVRLKTVKPEHASSVFIVNLLLGALAWVAVAASAPYLGHFLRSPDSARVLPLAGFGFILVAAGSVPTALLSRDMRWRESAVSDWGGGLVGAIVSITLAWQGFSYWSIVYGSLANQCVMAFARMWIVRWTPTLRFSPAALKEVLSFGSGIYAKNLLEYAAQNLDNLVVGRLLGVTALGLYDKAFTLTTRLMTNIQLSGPSVSFRVFALIHEQPERFRLAYRKVILSVTLVGYPILTAMMVAAPALIEVLFGTRWLGSVVPFQILCAASMLKLLTTYASSATQAKGMIWSEVKRHAAFTAVLVVAVAVLCRYGIPGAAAGVLVATAFNAVWMQTLVKRLTGVSWSDMLAPQVPAMICSAQIAVAILISDAVLRALIPAPRAWTSLACSVLVALCCHAAFVLFAPITAVREVVVETVHDLAPSLARYIPVWLVPKRVPAYSGQ